MAVNCVEDFYMAQLHGSHLCTLGERSEGAAIQLTTGGVDPKPLERQRWSIPPQSCMLRPRGPRCAAASERPPVTTRHLWGAMFSLPTVCVCVFMCLNCMFMCLDVYPCISLSLFMSVCIHDFIRNVSVRVSWSVRVWTRVPRRAGPACGLQSACQAARLASGGVWYSAIDHVY